MSRGGGEHDEASCTDGFVLACHSGGALSAIDPAGALGDEPDFATTWKAIRYQPGELTPSLPGL